MGGGVGRSRTPDRPLPPPTPSRKGRGSAFQGSCGHKHSVQAPADCAAGAQPNAAVSARGDLRDRATCGRRVGQRVQHDEVMDRAIVANRRDPDARIRQLPGIALGLIARHIVLGDDDERVGQVGQLFERRAQRCRGDVRAHRRIGQIRVPRLRHRRAGEPGTVGEALVRWRAEVRVGNRADQHLHVELWTAAFPRHQRDGGCDHAAYAVPGNRQAHGVQVHSCACSAT